MKKSKILTVIMAIVMMLSLAIPFTANAANVTITGDKNSNTYVAYKLMDLQTTHTGTGTDPSDYGYAYTLNSKYESIVLTALNITAGSKTDAELNAEVAADLGAMSDSDIRTFANTVYSAIQTAGLTSDATAASQEFTGLDQGYYLIVETTDPVATGDAISMVILDTAGQNDITIATKKDVPTVDKEVSDKADGTFGKSTDVSVGDTVYYQVTGKLPSNLDDFSSYTYNMIDTMSAGLTYNPGSLKVTVDGTDVTSLFTTPTFASQVLTTKCADILSLSVSGTPVAVTKDSVFVFTYSATLNSDAVVGNPGNPNTVHLEYSCNPNPGGTGETANTPDDHTVVFTYQLDVTKTDTSGKTITSDTAEFVLYRMNASSKEEYAQIADGKVSAWTTDKAAANEFTTVNGEFSIVGLDAGTYYLEETKAPAGYNLLTDPIKVDITSTIGTVANAIQITAINISINGGTAQAGDADKGSVSMKVENGTGGIFPGTGGIGTTLFILGGLLMIGACVGAFVIYRKRSVLNALKAK